MRCLNWCASLLGIALLLVISAGSAHAQATRTWVSGVGDDANPCSRTAPCKTFAGAISKTAAGGEINCIDPGGFGAVTITKAIAIICDNTQAGILVSGTNGVIVNAGPNDVVTLKGLDFEGLSSGINGINFLAGAALHVHKVQIRHFLSSGIAFTPSAGAAELYVADSYITDNGNSATVAGVLVRPTSTASVTFTINRTQFENNFTGVRIDSSAPGGVVKGVLRDSLIAGSTGNGVTAEAGASTSTMMLDHANITGNVSGLVVKAANATLISNQTSITANGTGLAVNPAGTLSSYKNNAVNGNTADGAFTAFIVPE
jgi:hypothetical protein